MMLKNIDPKRNQRGTINSLPNINWIFNSLKWIVFIWEGNNKCSELSIININRGQKK